MDVIRHLLIQNRLSLGKGAERSLDGTASFKKFERKDAKNFPAGKVPAPSVFWRNFLIQLPNIFNFTGMFNEITKPANDGRIICWYTGGTPPLRRRNCQQG